MNNLTKCTFPIGAHGEKLTIVFYNDRSVPKTMSAFFRFDPIKRQLRCRIKAKKGQTITAEQQRSVMADMQKIAREYNYDWQSLLAATERRR